MKFCFLNYNTDNSDKEISVEFPKARKNCPYLIEKEKTKSSEIQNKPNPLLRRNWKHDDNNKM